MKQLKPYEHPKKIRFLSFYHKKNLKHASIIDLGQTEKKIKFNDNKKIRNAKNLIKAQTKIVILN